MAQVKLVNGLLWAVNVLVGVGIVLFAFQFLLFAKRSDDLGITIDDDATPTVGKSAPKRYDLLAMLPNPLTKESKPTGTDPTTYAAGFPPGLKMIGSMGTTAFFERDPTVQAQADVNGPLFLHERDKEYEVAGWILVHFDSESATFRDQSGQTQVVRVGQPSTMMGDGPSTRGGRKNWAGQPYDPENFRRTRRVSEGGDREMWEVDGDESEWLNQNFEAALGQCQYRPSAAGGLEITYIEEGSVGTLRGLKQGDVIRSINGTPIKSIEDLRKIQGKSGRATTMNLVLDRAGAPYTIVYRITK